MSKEKEFAEALNHIEELLECIDWLGGDRYEVECAENMTKDAEEFLNQHKPEEVQSDVAWDVPIHHGVYVKRDDKTRFTVAQGKRNAKNLLRTSLKNVVCLAQHGDIYMKKVKSLGLGQKFKVDYNGGQIIVD